MKILKIDSIGLIIIGFFFKRRALLYKHSIRVILNGLVVSF